ncbi:MAG TPA: HEAT repeat domain-containing protein [Bryobacteraceae bacterium]|jgi:HEAT repeat protein|nr:HEAT repeat domain-containing protein [Bryobacteraceae bacterium]
MRLFAVLLLVSFASAETPGETAWGILDRAMHDSNPLKRKQAVVAMSVMRPEARPAGLLEAAVDDKDATVREAACATLGVIKSAGSAAKLRAALSDSVPEVIFAAAKALYNLDDPAGREVLTAVLLGEQSDASGFMPGSIRSMKLKLHDPKALLLIGVSQGAGLAGPFGMGVPLAEGLLKDNQALGKTAAALLLATDKSPETLAALKTALTEKSWAVRVAAARAIATRDAGTLYPDVAKLLDDKREDVQVAAAASLIRLRQPPPVQPKTKTGTAKTRTVK